MSTKQRSADRAPAPNTGNPWTGLLDLQKSMNQLLSALDFPWAQNVERDFDFSPSCDVSENDQELILRFDTPGMAKENMNVEFKGNRVTVRGERRQETRDKTGKNHMSEVYYGTFTRSLTLPEEALPEKATADYSNGVLTIKVPKADVQKPKTIPIT